MTIDTTLPVQVIEFNDIDLFRDECKELAEAGYKVSSSWCGMITDGQWAGVTAYRVVMVRPDVIAGNAEERVVEPNDGGPDV